MNKVFIFVLGAAAGSLLTWKFVEEKYRKIADEEIESVIEKFRNSREELINKFEAYDNKIEKPDKPKLVEHYIEKNDLDGTVTERKHYEQQIEDAGYTVELQPAKESVAPYTISPEEYGEFGNETISWMYYEDGVLADDNDKIIGDYEEIIGDALDHFGEYEDDCVHVRNEDLEWDIEILKSEKTFTELNKGEN